MYIMMIINMVIVIIIYITNWFICIWHSCGLENHIFPAEWWNSLSFHSDRYNTEEEDKSNDHTYTEY